MFRTSSANRSSYSQGQSTVLEVQGRIYSQFRSIFKTDLIISINYKYSTKDFIVDLAVETLLVCWQSILIQPCLMIEESQRLKIVTDSKLWPRCFGIHFIVNSKQNSLPDSNLCLSIWGRHFRQEFYCRGTKTLALE